MSVLVIALVVSACGGGALAPANDQQTKSPTDGVLPAPGLGTHEGSIVSNDTAWGNAHYQAQHATDGAPWTELSSSGMGISNAAYSLYQLAARVGETPTMLTVNTLLYDSDPLVSRPEEGFWVAYGDFSGGGAGFWHFAGPFREQQVRVPLPGTATVVNSGGLIFVAVLALDSNQLRIFSVQAGYDLGNGYEQYRLAQPRGNSAGRSPIIELGSDGEPQIAYLRSPISISGGPIAEMAVAQRVSGSWVVQVPTAYQVNRQFAFACGDGGRRALVVTEELSGDVHLLYDDGGGSFATDITLTAAYNGDLIPDVAFISGTDDSLGPRDTALVVYAENFVAPNCEIHYYRYDGVNPPAMGNVIAGSIREPGRVHIMVEDHQATVSLPVSPVPPAINATFIQYSAVVDAWAASPITDLPDIKIESSDEAYSLQLNTLGSGEYVLGFQEKAASMIDFWRFSGGLWSSLSQDRVSCIPPAMGLDFAARSDDSAVMPVAYGNSQLAVLTGTVGSGSYFQFTALNSEQYSSLEQSVTADGDVAHIASMHGGRSSLIYYRLENDGTHTDEVVDNGGDGLALTIGPPQAVQVGGELHVFYGDYAHLRLMHAQNKNGVWQREAEPIPIPGAFVYYILGAGVLESTGQIWVGVADAMDLGVYLVLGTPGLDGTWTWTSHRFLSQAYGLYAALADDETNIGCVYAVQGVMTPLTVNFAWGPPDAMAQSIEIISTEIETCGPRWSVGFNPVASTWDLACQNQSNLRCHLFHRDGPNNWQGPYTVADRENPGDNIGVQGITFAQSTGLLQIVITEHDGTLNHDLVNVYQQNPGGFSFAAPLNVLDLDSVTHHLGEVYVTPDADGNPVIAILTKLVADTFYAVDFFNFDGVGWTSTLTWTSPLSEMVTANQMDCLVVMPDGQPAFVGVNQPGPAPVDYGKVYVYYPW